MSINYAVNGRYGKTHKKQSLLDDAEQVRKELENERRILRLQQVREESNNLARKIRQEVEDEKTRQLKNLEKIKQQELNCWRQHVMVKKNQDYRTAIFQVGEAHRAAKEENERLEARKEQRIKANREKVRKAKAKAAAAAATAAATSKITAKTSSGKMAPKQTKSIAVSAATQNNDKRCTAGHTPKKDTHCSAANVCCRKRKRNCCCHIQTHCCCRYSDDSSDDSGSLLSSNSTSSFHLDAESVKCNKNNKNGLQKTPAVILDVNIDSDNSVDVTTKGAIEINDQHIETNRCFCIMGNKNTEDSTETNSRTTKSREVEFQPQQLPTPALQPPKPRFTQISELVMRTTRVQEEIVNKQSPREDMRTTSPRRIQPTCHADKEKSPRKTNTQSPRKNFTTKDTSSTNKDSSKATTTTSKSNMTTTTSQTTTKPTSITSRTTSQKLTAKKPRENSDATTTTTATTTNASSGTLTRTATDASEVTATTQATSTSPRAARAAVSTATVVLRRVDDVPQQSTGSSGRVKFYDYKNKYHRDYDASAKSVQLNISNGTELNAMDHAEIENNLQRLRAQEIEKRRLLSEERGQYALEREQVRRDCAELTEKLDALSRQHPQLLKSDANFIPSHRFADVAARREEKMNELMEQMLLKPAIITCPEVPQQTKQNGRDINVHAQPATSLNVAEHWKTADDCVTISSESCYSILEDQTEQLRSDLKDTATNDEKAEKLRNLLERIEKIRATLMQELEAGKTTVDGNNVEDVISGIRKEREKILCGMKKKSVPKEKSKSKDTTDDEDCAYDKPQKSVKKSKAKEETEVISHDKQKPLEIIIKVSSDGQVKKCVARPKGAAATAASVRKHPTSRKYSVKKYTIAVPENTPEEEAAPQNVQRQCSYDSNSTAYRSLPPVLNLHEAAATSGAPAAVTCKTKAAVAPLNPVIAAYVNRLLGMKHSSIQKLNVSSTDVPTPSSSVINMTSNKTQESTLDESLIDVQRMERVQNFIEDNRSFVHELEDTLRSHSTQSLESSLRAFDEIWLRRLEDTKKRQQEIESARRKILAADACKQKENVVTAQKPASPRVKTQQKTEPPKRSTARQTEQKSKVTPSESEKQIERYAKLTENCTQRIAELTDLISKVREEKQRLLEVTLTSASEGGRNSTEYMDLPSAMEQQPQHTRTNSERSHCSDAHVLPMSSISEPINEPLQKNKLIGCSRDSGICESRPLTSQGQVAEVEAAKAQRREKQITAAMLQRTIANVGTENAAHELSTIIEVDTPAPSRLNSTRVTEKSFSVRQINDKSKQRQPVSFPTFEEYAKELELDVSLINPDQSIRLQREFKELISAINTKCDSAINYRQFPSIASYFHNVTATHFNMDGLETNEDVNSPQTIRDLLQCLRMANINVRTFPAKKEYMQHITANKSDADDVVLIDSASLENISDEQQTTHPTHIDSDSTDSLNIEAELKKRNLLKSSFRLTNPTADNCVASSTRRESAAFYTGAMPMESGIDELSNSANDVASSKLARELQRMGMEWPSIMMQRERQAAALSSGSSEPTTSAAAAAKRATQHTVRSRNHGTTSRVKSQSTTVVSTNDESGEVGRSLNLREFLKKELLKHSGSSTSSADSLKSNFLHSIINSLTPHTHNGVGQATGATDRQKTSTPVVSSQSNSRSPNDSSATTTQLFSGESRISSVHNSNDEAPPLTTEKARRA